MVSLAVIKERIDYQQTDENFINYLKILNMNGVIVFSESDISKKRGKLFASKYLYNQIISVYGNATLKKEIKIG
ncbi:hypothetical protein BZ21_796 [Yersinia pseudotuberculosis]|uniref:hypothetical protein n=1 Tax=Yersinia pseudotuberculosis TaxID=633 RepID=UPI0004F8D6F7|nr:hypothetical protein [Yersinia pseudotuberculosis]AIN15531.1 hypothetical protein DJ40_4134 [Yersinia pseudotuberculosis]AJJ03416.1 hypothetical protein BZ21_796 [Yersinia pseudotuberculosis]AXY33934.1 hypothetical protein CEQ20_11240 [Yersinia pseudotuberculosis]AYX09603.1 hypothetical protein EGX52_01330 [Yersinia pseudotuberculosis]MBO1561553.1 hypothetical protein [Yersinia pseudotuberculosis]